MHLYTIFSVIEKTANVVRIKSSTQMILFSTQMILYRINRSFLVTEIIGAINIICFCVSTRYCKTEKDKTMSARRAYTRINKTSHFNSLATASKTTVDFWYNWLPQSSNHPNFLYNSLRIYVPFLSLLHSVQSEAAGPASVTLVLKCLRR